MEKITILFVDDEKSILRSLERYLIEAPYKKYFADSVDRALDILADKPVHVVVTDMKMPEKDGLSLLRHLKKFYPEITRMVLSGYTDVAEIIPGINSGEIFRYMLKPLEPSEFKNTLDDAVENYLLRREKNELIQRLTRANQELTKSKEQLLYLALHDDLTDLYNTRHLYNDLEKRIESNSGQFSIIFMDMDNFKNIVDTHGHPNGSLALKEVAATIKKTIGDPCYGVAYGGDEFIVVLPGHNRAMAITKAEKIRHEMKKTDYLSEKGFTVKLSASFGIAMFPDDAVHLTELLSCADTALFEAKGMGKDTVRK